MKKLNFQSHDPSQIILIYSSSFLSNYQCWKQLCCLTYLWKLILFSDSLMSRKFKQTFIWN